MKLYVCGDVYELYLYSAFNKTLVALCRGGSRGRVQGVSPLPPEMTCGFLIQLVFCKKKTMWFIGVEVEQETSAPLPKKNPGSTPALHSQCNSLRLNYQ